MAALSAAEAGARVRLLEKGDRLGRKLLISGGGRCNVTNAGSVEHLIAMIPGNGKWLRDAFAQVSNHDLIRLVESLQVPLREEDHGRMFPVSGRAKDVADALIGRLMALGAQVSFQVAVESLVLHEGQLKGVRDRSGHEWKARAVVLATGGCSVPATGSTGDGYPMAEAAGHSITPLFPTEVPIRCPAPWVQSKRLMGLSLRDTRLSLRDAKGKLLTEQVGDALITHFGLSGPAALRLGHYVSKALMQGKGPLTVAIDLLPAFAHPDAVDAELLARAKAHPKRALRNAWAGLLPERPLALLGELAGLDLGLECAHLPGKGRRAFAELSKALVLPVAGTLSLQEAFVTGGGVGLKGVDPKSLGSRLCPGLFFAGELLDLHAHTGGYNITIALSTGRVAGRWAARFAASESAG